MKSSVFLLALWLGANAGAQTPPPKQPANPPVAAKPTAAQTAPPSASQPKPSATAISPKTATQAAPGNPAPRNNVKPRTANVPAATSAVKPAVSSAPSKHRAKPGSPATAVAPGAAPKVISARRDPFVSPIVDRIRGVGCTGSGKQCLVISEISLRGVVHSPSGFIAVVINGEHTYFLRVNDPLADGSVERITRDAIILRERSLDALGRTLTREVTKKLGAPPV